MEIYQDQREDRKVADRYRTLNIITAIIFITLSVIAMFFPELITMLFQIEGNESVFFIGRRASILFLGLSTLLWFQRHSTDTISIQAVCMGMTVLCGGMAMLGLIEYLRGFCGIGIMLAVGIELMLCILYFKLWSTIKRHDNCMVDNSR